MGNSNSRKYVDKSKIHPDDRIIYEAEKNNLERRKLKLEQQKQNRILPDVNSSQQNKESLSVKKRRKSKSRSKRRIKNSRRSRK